MNSTAFYEKWIGLSEKCIKALEDEDEIIAAKFISARYAAMAIAVEEEKAKSTYKE